MSLYDRGTRGKGEAEGEREGEDEGEMKVKRRWNKGEMKAYTLA
jgi:hypothetical protein